MRGGTSKGLLFHREDLPEDRSQWDSIFLQAMGDPDPKQIDGLGGTVSSNNKIVIVWKSDEKDVDVEYLVGQVIVGKSQVDYKSNCGNMTAAVGPFAVEEGLVDAAQPLAVVRMLNRNTDKHIQVSVPVEDGKVSVIGDCRIAGVDGTAPELKVAFMDPAGSMTGRLMPTGRPLDTLEIPGFGKLEATLLDVSNPIVIVRAEDVGLIGGELPGEIDSFEEKSGLLERIRGTAGVLMGLGRAPQEITARSPGAPKIALISAPRSFRDISAKVVEASEMDIAARVISVFKCHKACPLTSACAISTAALMEGTIVSKTAGRLEAADGAVRIGHPSGVMTLYPQLHRTDSSYSLSGVAVQRTARRIMDGTLYIRD